MMIVSDAPSCGITYNNYSDESTGVIHALRVIKMTLEVSFMLLESSIILLENIYSAGVTYDNHHLIIKIFF